MDIGWGELWKAISVTFQAGRDVNIAQMNERMQKRQIASDRQLSFANAQSERLIFLDNAKGKQIQLITVILVVVVISIAIIYIFRKKK